MRLGIRSGEGAPADSSAPKLGTRSMASNRGRVSLHWARSWPCLLPVTECTAHGDYKQAIVQATSDDIVLTDKISGVPVAVIKTPYIERVGTRAGALMGWMLRHPRFKHWARLWYTLKSIWQLKRASMQGMNYKDYFQAGKSVDGVVAEESAEAVIRRFAEAVEPGTG